jgi:hypothetical protein
MKTCESCQVSYPDSATACSNCGGELVKKSTTRPTAIQKTPGNMRLWHEATGKEIPLQLPGEWVLGRADGPWMPDLDLEPLGASADEGVSRKHAMVAIQGATVTITDTRSANGTLINDKLIPTETPQTLTDGDVITLGNLTLVFKTSD